MDLNLYPTWFIPCKALSDNYIFMSLMSFGTIKLVMSSAALTYIVRYIFENFS